MGIMQSGDTYRWEIITTALAMKYDCDKMEINLTQQKYMTVFIEFINVPSVIVKYDWDP